ncbi:MAG: DUF177 domain-containing protein [Candidatus Omnitrophica bacterium]|nr:DUF177 domain-containing protein [Candidatus Omnitrophota bacterium]
MRIDTRQIPQQGMTLREEFTPDELDCAAGVCAFAGPLSVEADVSKITNALTVKLRLRGCLRMTCGRCLKEFDEECDKQLVLNYRVDASRPVICLDPDIREELILGYPINPLCHPGCRGLCARCGKNLNEGGCSCGTT